STCRWTSVVVHLVTRGLVVREGLPRRPRCEGGLDMTPSSLGSRGGLAPGRTAFLFDLDGTLVDSVYQHVLAWREAMAAVGIELAVWNIHRRIGMSGGLMANAILRETGHTVTAEEAGRLVRLHGEAYARLAGQVRPR